MDNRLSDAIHPAPRPAVMLLRVRLILLGGVFLSCCFPALELLVRSCAEQDEYGFRIAVPFLAALWIWTDRLSLARLSVTPALRGGAALLAGGCLMLLLGQLSATTLLQELAPIVVLAALVLLLLGPRFLRRLALPLAFLALAAPVLDPFLGRLHQPFQVFAAMTAGQALSFLGVPVHRSAQFLELPGATLEVAEACSGVRFLVSTVVLSVPLLFITQRSRRARMLLFLLALAIGVAANPARVTLIGLWVHYAKGDVHGPLHLLHGYAVYLLGLALLFGGAWALQRRAPEAASAAGEEGAGAEQGGLREFHPFNQAWFLAFSILLVCCIALQLYTVRPVPLKQGLDRLPSELAGWELSDRVRQVGAVGGQQQVLRYRNASGREIHATIVYFESQNGSQKLVPPLPGPAVFADRAVLSGPGSAPVAVNRTVIAGQGGEEARLFWYRVNGRTLAARSRVKWWNAVDGALLRRNNAGMVLLSRAVPPGEREQALADLEDLGAKLLPHVNDCIP